MPLLLFSLLIYISFSSASVFRECSKADSYKSFVNRLVTESEDEGLVVAHFQSEVFSGKSAEHFDCGPVHQRVKFSEKHRILEERFGTKVKIMLLSRSHAEKKVIIPKAYVILESTYTSRYIDQDGKVCAVELPFSYFYAIDPKWYDGYNKNLIPAKAVYLVMFTKFDKTSAFSPEVIRAAIFAKTSVLPPAIIAATIQIRQRIVQERFFQPVWPPKTSKRLTVPFQLALPSMNKDASFHPTTFRHSLWSFGDILKVLFLVAIRDGVPYFQFMRQIIPEISFELFYSDTGFVFSSCPNTGFEKTNTDCFIQVITGQPFRPIEKGATFAYQQYLPSLSSPLAVCLPLQALVSTTLFFIIRKSEDLIGSSAKVFTEIAQFRAICREDPDWGKNREQSALMASVIRLEVQIPEGTTEEHQMIAALAALRRMEVPGELLPPLLSNHIPST